MTSSVKWPSSDSAIIIYEHSFYGNIQLTQEGYILYSNKSHLQCFVKMDDLLAIAGRFDSYKGFWSEAKLLFELPYEGETTKCICAVLRNHTIEHFENFYEGVLGGNLR